MRRACPSPALSTHRRSVYRIFYREAIFGDSWPWRLQDIDSGLTMQSHVRLTVSRCFAVLRQLRIVRRQVPTSVFQSLIVALVLSDLITATVSCLDSLITSSSVFSLFTTLRLGWFSEFDGHHTLPQRSSAFTGCASQKVIRSIYDLTPPPPPNNCNKRFLDSFW